jgi:hypothetical protein
VSNSRLAVPATFGWLGRTIIHYPLVSTAIAGAGSRRLIVKTAADKTMNETMTYCKPDIVLLGSVAETICGTHIKGHTGVIESIHWGIVPAYELDE